MPAANMKVTVELPKALLKNAQSETGQGITATIREGLRLLASRRAQRELMAYRGKVKFSINLNELREDRD